MALFLGLFSSTYSALGTCTKRGDSRGADCTSRGTGRVGYLAEAASWLAWSKMVSAVLELADRAFGQATARLQIIPKPAPVQARSAPIGIHKAWEIIHQAGTGQNNRII